MAKYDANLGARKTELRRFRLFLLIMLPVLIGLGYLVTLNPPEMSQAETHERRVSFADAVKEIWGAIRMTYSMDLTSDDDPREHRHRN